MMYKEINVGIIVVKVFVIVGGIEFGICMMIFFLIRIVKIMIEINLKIIVVNKLDLFIYLLKLK